MKETQDDHVLHLALVWGFAESGLGGIFHALKLPFTAFVLVAISLAAMARIAINSRRPFASIMKALFWVLTIKFAGSPHSPFTAYVAVAFQGLVGAFMFSWRVNTFSCMLAGFLMMAESAMQKPLVATLLFGDSLWIAIDNWYEKISSFFGVKALKQFSYKLIISYVLLYSIWGLCWGWMMAKFLRTIQERKNAISRLFSIVSLIHYTKVDKPKTKKRFQLMVWLIIGIAGLLSFWQSDWMILFRVIFILFVFYALVLPLLHFFLKRYTKANILNQYYERLPIYKQRLAVTFAYAKTKKNLWQSFVTFVFWIQAFMFLPIENQK